VVRALRRASGTPPGCAGFIAVSAIRGSSTPGYRLARLRRAAPSTVRRRPTVVHLPERGIRGNTHFPMSDLNNLQIADQLSDYLAAKGLD
jgi:hypothetical protein